MIRRQWFPLKTRIFGPAPHPEELVGPRLPYTIPALELRRLLKEAKKFKDQGSDSDSDSSDSESSSDTDTKSKKKKTKKRTDKKTTKKDKGKKSTKKDKDKKKKKQAAASSDDESDDGKDSLKHLLQQAASLGSSKLLARFFDVRATLSPGLEPRGSSLALRFCLKDYESDRQGGRALWGEPPGP